MTSLSREDLQRLLGSSCWQLSSGELPSRRVRKTLP